MHRLLCCLILTVSLPLHAEEAAVSNGSAAPAPAAAAPASDIYNPSCPTAKDESSLNACLNSVNPGTPADKTVFQKVDPAILPPSPVTGDLEQFKKAVAAEIKACDKKKMGFFKIRIQENGKTEQRLITRDKWCLATNTKLLDLANKPNQTFAGLMADAKKEFDWYHSNCDDPNQNGEVQVTGYHNPIIEARTEPSGEFIHPLYSTPPDPRDRKHSRSEINSDHVLNNLVNADGSTLILGYVKSELEVTLAQVEGSVITRDETGAMTKLNYSAQNGRKNYMPARILKCQCVDPKYWETVPGIRQYFIEHKDKEAAWLNINPSYVYFEKAKDGPYGGSGQVLTPDHSIAVDTSVYPYGLLALLNRAPVKKTDATQGLIPHTATLTLAEDTGGAIRGCHVDLYVGASESGGEADSRSGKMNDAANLFLALPKDIWTTGIWKDAQSI